MPPVGFEPTISVLERAKTVRALDRAATAIGSCSLTQFQCTVRQVTVYTRVFEDCKRSAKGVRARNLGGGGMEVSYTSIMLDSCSLPAVS
jgi:hypothetical protein